ncbi:MAG TPA: ATP synthase F0 subunit B [Terriglobia bacterium]|nr:ATP synthase F0 subunit B [Terriglobia bacterium]
MLNIDLSVAVTVLYLIILYLFLSRFFFGPINEILKKRHELIEGRLEDSRKRLEQAELETAQYEQAIRNARSEAYRHQEVQRERALAEKADLIAKARKEAEKAVEEGRARLAAQAETARKKIESEVDALAKRLATTILRD